MGAMSTARIFLIDDHALFRSGMRMVLLADLGTTEVLEAGSLEEALQHKGEAPTLVLLDIHLRGLNGLDGTALLKRHWPHAAIIMLSADNAPSTVRDARQRGAVHFVCKADPPQRILSAVRHVLLGEPAPTDAGSGAGAAETSADAARHQLTPRQCEVLDLLCQGLSNKLIGRRLNLSENTVRGHVQAVLAALQVASRSEAAFAARSRGLVG